MRRPLCLVVLCGSIHVAAAARADDAVVAGGASVQQAIDAAPAGATVRLAAGTFAGRLTITRPVTLEGPGWDRTFVEAGATPKGHTDAEKLTFATALDGAADERAQMGLIRAFLDRGGGATVTVRGAARVTLRGVGVRGMAGSGRGGESLVSFADAADAHVVDCGLVGPAEDGIDVTDSSAVEVRHTLVAAVWGTGVSVDGSRGGGRAGSVHLVESDVRNCYYAGVRLGDDKASVVERCRISGAAWHGIRYDDGAPTITGNLIFGNARCGIYASGATHATVRGNVFWRNEMSAISCWLANGDTIDRNTVVGNLEAGIAVLGDARPTVTRNVIAASPVGLACNAVDGSGGNPRPAVADNLFWHDDADQTRMGKPDPLPAGNTDGDPHFAAADRADFALPTDAAAGATDVLAVASPWPVQAAERAIIPDGETRDFSQWKKPAGVR